MPKHKCPPPGAPAWLATFADMMTLLMAFFVLLLSLAEIDATKYRAVAGSMKQALGVKVDSPLPTLPDGEIPPDPEKTEKVNKPADCEIKQGKAVVKANQQFELLKAKLSKLDVAHNLHIRRINEQIIIRIEEQGVFKSASDRISQEFLPKIAMLRDILAELDGGVLVTGHTDDIPISNGRFRSNWELSSARAVSVVHELLKNEAIPPKRLSAVGYADSRPLTPNVDIPSRRKNRRVDIVLTPQVDPTVGLEGSGDTMHKLTPEGGDPGATVPEIRLDGSDDTMPELTPEGGDPGATLPGIRLEGSDDTMPELTPEGGDPGATPPETPPKTGEPDAAVPDVPAKDEAPAAPPADDLDDLDE
ncbi:MAG: chemotaxis protein MotB [Myxococcota bacterium]|jgi:chemotaxis protein MotB